MVYLQVTRGAADRDFAYPASPVPSLVLFTQARAARRHARGARRHPGDRHARHPLGAARHQDRAAPRPVDVQDDGPARPARTTPGWSRTASSPRAPRTTPGSSPARAASSPATSPTSILHGITRAAVIASAARGADPRRGAALHPRRGAGRGRGLHHRRLGLRDAGRRDRRPARRRRSPRPGDPPAARALPRREPRPRDLEHFGVRLNREGFPRTVCRDSNCMLEREASVHGSIPFR